MKLVIFVISLVALRLADALQAAPQWKAQSWFEIQKSLNLKVERGSETVPLLGVEDGHELGDINAEHLPAWNEFKKTFKREFSSFEEEVARFKIFVENLLFVNAHNQLYREGKSSYELGINEFADMSNKEFVASKNGLRLQVKPSAAKRRRPLMYRIQSHVTDLPTSVDWRTKGYVTPVKNQAHCGSCWSFSTTGALEGQWFAKTGQLISLSEQQLVDCSEKWGNNGCNGGLMDNAFTYIKAVGGIESESEYPYTAEDGKCKFQKSEVVANDTGYTDVEQDNEAALLQAVATVGPVSVAIDASHMSFQTYKQGIYDEPSCSSTDLDHGVLVVGYGQDSSGGKYWIVKNSWGPGWGEQGYIRMARDKNNMCGIASAASYPTV